MTDIRCQRCDKVLGQGTITDSVARIYCEGCYWDEEADRQDRVYSGLGALRDE